MTDMSKPEYLTTDWIEELQHRADVLRRESEEKRGKAELIDSLRLEFEHRIREHEKHRPADE